MSFSRLLPGSRFQVPGFRRVPDAARPALPDTCNPDVAPGAWLPRLIPFLRGLSVAAVIGCGFLLGRVLTSPSWSNAVTGVGLSAFLLLLLARPIAGLLLWLVLAPYAPYIYLTIDLGRGIPVISLTRVTLAVTLIQLIGPAILTARSGARTGLARFTGVEFAMLAFLVGIGFSIPTSWLGPVGAAQTVFDFIFIPCCIYYLARNWLRGGREFQAVIAVIAVIGAALGVITTREQLTGVALFSPVPYQWFYEYYLRRVLSLFGSQAYMSMALAIPVPLLLYGISRPAGWRRRALLVIALLIDLAGVFMAYVRAGWLAALLSVVVLIVFSPAVRRTLLPIVPVVVFAGFALAAAAIINPRVLSSRITSKGPIDYRVKALEVAAQVIGSAPFTGVGYDNYGQAAARFDWQPEAYQIRNEFTTPHNSYVYVAASGGLFALIPYLAIFATLAWRGRYFWRRRVGRDLVAVLWSTLLGYLAGIATFDVLNAQYANLLLFLIVGALLGRLETLDAVPHSASLPGEVVT